MKELQHQSYHFFDNATNGLDFGTNKHGSNKHGINGCTLGEVLHQLPKSWITVTLDEFFKSSRNFLTSLPDRFLVCYLIRVTMTIPESSFQGHFPLFCICRGTRPLVCFYYSLSAFTQRPAGPRISPIATPLAGPNLLIPKTESFCHLFEVLLVYKTWFWLDAVEKSTIVGGTQVRNATKHAMTTYVDTVNCTQGHDLKMTKTHAPLHSDYNLCNFGSNNNSHSAV
jgi:hypothetical protein